MKKKQNTLICKFIGSSPESKIIEYLWEIQDRDITLNEIVLIAKINRKRAYEFLRYLIRLKVLVLSVKVKHFRFYRLNINNSLVERMNDFFDKIVEREQQ